MEESSKKEAIYACIECFKNFPASMRLRVGLPEYRRYGCPYCRGRIIMLEAGDEQKGGIKED